jgi:hypothetical protein
LCCSVLSFLCIMLWTIACLSCCFFWPLCCLSVIYSRPLFTPFVILNLSVGCHKFCWQGNKRHYQTLSYPCWEMDTIGSILYIDGNIKIIGFKCNLFPGFEAVGYIYMHMLIPLFAYFSWLLNYQISEQNLEYLNAFDHTNTNSYFIRHDTTGYPLIIIYYFVITTFGIAYLITFKTIPHIIFFQTKVTLWGILRCSLHQPFLLCYSKSLPYKVIIK